MTWLRRLWFRWFRKRRDPWDHRQWPLLSEVAHRAYPEMTRENAWRRWTAGIRGE